jgi:hypothetical protein
LVQQLASSKGLLLAVCGKPDDTTGEVWSRQLGVWMYCREWTVKATSRFCAVKRETF